MKYKLERQKKEITIYKDEQRFGAGFKYHNSYWCYFLPVKSMYLMTISEVIKSIEKLENYNNDRKYKCEYKVIEFIK